MHIDFEHAVQMSQEEGITKIVTVGMVSGGWILTGKRRDNGKWTSPGGHVDEGEDILTAAIREVKEEAGIEIDASQLEFIGCERVAKGRGGFPFSVFAFLAHVDKEKATAKFDPDKEIETWKWVDISKSTPELKEENRHAKIDAILVHYGINRPGEARLQNRRMADIAKDLQSAGFDESPPAPPKKKDPKQEPGKPPAPGAAGTEEQRPVVPEPKPKTPADMLNSPDAYLPAEEVTGDAPQERIPDPAGSRT